MVTSAAGAGDVELDSEVAAGDELVSAGKGDEDDDRDTLALVEDRVLDEDPRTTPVSVAARHSLVVIIPSPFKSNFENSAAVELDQDAEYSAIAI
jgi:hypothetical protein